ncbi:MAG: response regulator transcription factor [Bacteroidota bacterium]
MRDCLNVLIVDDHQMFLDGVMTILKDLPEVNVVGAFENGREALDFIKNQEVDLLVSDIAMPEIDGKKLCKMVKEVSPDTKTLIVSMYEDIYHITEMLRQGIYGYLPKNAGKQELIAAVRTIGGGETFYSDRVKDTVMKSMSGQFDKNKKLLGSKLTKREIEVIRLIATEHTSAQIAEKLFISLNTAETHRKNIFRKANVKNMAGLIRYALKSGIIE